MADTGGEDITLELNELRAALLERQEEENEAPIWHSNNLADDSFLRLATTVDVEALLESISTRSSRLKNELSAAALALAPGDTTSFAAAPSDALGTINSLKADLSRCSAELVSNTSLSKFEAEEIAARDTRLGRIARLEQLLNALQLLASHQRYCDDFDKKLELGQVVEATQILQALDDCTTAMAKISSMAGAAGGKNASTMSASRVAKAARVQAKSRRAALQARLDEALLYALQFDASKHELQLFLDAKSERLQNSIRLESVIEALKALKILNQRLQERIAQPLLKHFLQPILSDPVRFNVEQDLSYPNRPVLRLKPVSKSSTEQPTTTVQTCHKVLSDVLTILRFVWAEVLNRDLGLNQQLGLYTQIESLLSNVLRNAVPDSYDELRSFEDDMSTHAARFDQELERIGGSTKSSTKLSQFLADVEVSFARKLREKYAERVRSVVRSGEDLHGSERVDEGEEPEFFVGSGEFSVAPEMRISKCARKIIVIANEALREAVTAPSVCTEALIKAARSCFDLFRALVPYLRKDEMLVNPRCAMLHRNDCDYIAHHLVLLSHRHRKVKGFVSVDLAPYFFEDAESTFQKEVAMRCKQIEDACCGGGDAGAATIDFSQILSKSDAVYKAWNEVLPHWLAERTRARLGESLVDGVFKAVCSKNVNIASLPERRALLKRLLQFSEAVKTRGASPRRIEQLCKALQPHMSLFPLFADLVDAELGDWPPESLVALANALFSKSATPEELKRFEEKVLFY